MNLSKSKYCEGIQCKKILWLDKHCPEERGEPSNQAVLDNGTEVGQLAKTLFGEYIDIDFNENLQQMIEDTKKAIQENERGVITEASFLYDQNFCSVDLLKKENDEYEIYEVKSSTEVKDIYKEDASYQYYVLTSLGYNVKRVCIVHLNSHYVREGDLDLNKLFTIVDITDTARKKQKEIPKKIEEIREYVGQEEEPSQQLGLHCTKPYDCPYFAYCTKELEKPNVFDIRGMKASTKFILYEKGVITFEDLLQENLNDKYLEQVDFEVNSKEDKIEKEKIQAFLDTLTYPLYFLDFETFQQAIPMYDGVSPYSQIPFQYSLHYLEEDQELKHKEFLAAPGIDPRRSLAEALVRDIPKDVCTLAYNMSFEKTVIKNLAKRYPDLSSHLMNIHDHIKDLMIPFYNRNYYTRKMQGSYSIKYVLPALFPDDPSLNYHNLEEVHNGSEAMNAYANMGNLTQEEQESLRRNLLKYCGLDTYAMVKIYEKLLESVERHKCFQKK